METNNQVCIGTRLPFYPTYEEWKLISFCSCISSCNSLFILPVRNGNLDRKLKEAGKYEPFYPTYEEWKLFQTHCDCGVFCLFILPMRNGNISQNLPSRAVTPFYPTYEEWKQNFSTSFVDGSRPFLSYL